MTQRTRKRMGTEGTRGKRIRRDDGQKADDVTKDASEHFAKGVIRANRKGVSEEREDGASSSIPVSRVGTQQEGASSPSSACTGLGSNSLTRSLPAVPSVKVSNVGRSIEDVVKTGGGICEEEQNDVKQSVAGMSFHDDVTREKLDPNLV